MCTACLFYFKKFNSKNEKAGIVAYGLVVSELFEISNFRQNEHNGEHKHQYNIK